MRESDWSSDVCSSDLFDIEMGLAIRSLLINDSDSSFYVFYDKNQNVFEMDFELSLIHIWLLFLLRLQQQPHS